MQEVASTVMCPSFFPFCCAHFRWLAEQLKFLYKVYWRRQALTVEPKSVAGYLLLLLKDLSMTSIHYLSVFYSIDNCLNQHEKMLH